MEHRSTWEQMVNMERFYWSLAATAGPVHPGYVMSASDRINVNYRHRVFIEIFGKTQDHSK